MDNELKQRLIGAVVITALAAIFVPMLFDDPVDNGKAVTELTIPPAPADAAAETANSLPADKADVLSRPDSDLSVSEEEPHTDAVIDGQVANTPPGSEQIEHPNVGQPGMPDNVGSDISEDGLVADSSQNSESRSEEPTLDTGIIDEAARVKASEPIAKKAAAAVKKAEKETVTPSVKSTESEKPKSKSVIDKPKTTKIKAEDPQKTNSKLTRWSIQAGSFSKKENAQALVDKLRKQGLPASIAAKGNLFRIKVGPALDKKRALDMKAKLDKQNIQSYLQSE